MHNIPMLAILYTKFLFIYIHVKSLSFQNGNVWNLFVSHRIAQLFSLEGVCNGHFMISQFLTPRFPRTMLELINLWRNIVFVILIVTNNIRASIILHVWDLSNNYTSYQLVPCERKYNLCTRSQGILLYLLPRITVSVYTNDAMNVANQCTNYEKSH